MSDETPLDYAYTGRRPHRELIRKQAFEFALTAWVGRGPSADHLVAEAKKIEAYLAGDK